METMINTYPIEITNLKDASSVEEGISSYIKVQMIKNPSVLANKHFMINRAMQVCMKYILPKVKQENTTNMVRKKQVTRTMYQHHNHKIRFLNQSIYQHCYRLTYILNNIQTERVGSQSIHLVNHNTTGSFQEPYKCTVSYKIELGWVDTFTTQQFFPTLIRYIILSHQLS